MHIPDLSGVNGIRTNHVQEVCMEFSIYGLKDGLDFAKRASISGHVTF